MRRFTALAATAVLTVLSAGTASTAAHTDAVGTSQVATATINEVAIGTLEPDSGLTVSAVEVYKPAGLSIDGYQLQACSSAAGASPQTIATFNSAADSLIFVVVADQSGWTYTAAGLSSMDRAGGVRLVDASGDYVDAVTFDPSSTSVDACLTTGAPATAIPAESQAPNGNQSAQRLPDWLGPFTLCVSTLGGPNCQ